MSPSLLITLAVVASGAMAYRDIKVSAEAMLWMEAASVTCIVAIVALTLWKHGLHLDWEQFRLKGVTGSGVRLGLVLALFSFVGFESATTLGEEAREPLKTIPRAVLQCALRLRRLLYRVRVYAGAELSWSGGEAGSGGGSAAYDGDAGGREPAGHGDRYRGNDQHVRVHAGVHYGGCPGADADGASRAGASQDARDACEERDAALRRGSDGGCVPASGGGAGCEGREQLGYLRLDGALATYGFITVYALVCIALPLHLRRVETLSVGVMALSAAGFVAMVLALAGSVYPVPTGPYGWLPYIYLVYLLGGLGWYVMRRRAVSLEL